MDLRGARIAVTGATGFLGRYIVEALLARGAHVIGVVRNPDRVPALRARGVELRRADLAERDHLTAGLAGADALVSNAALFSLRNRRVEDHHRANVEGTDNVFHAAADAGVRRVVQVSSVAVYAGRAPALDEDAPQHAAASRPTFLNTYAISKALSEQRAWAIARERDLALTCVRPCAIYGAFDQNFTRIVRRVLRLPVVPLPTGFRLALVYAGDVAEAIALALEREVAVGKAYNTTGEAHPLREFIAAWRAAGGRAPRMIVPLPLSITLGFDHGRARADLGWRNRPLVEALRETFALERAG